jgi:hypothetical protein
VEIIFPTHFCAIRKITDEKNKGRVGDKNNKGKVGTKIIKGELGQKIKGRLGREVEFFANTTEQEKTYAALYGFKWCMCYVHVGIV